MIERIQLTLSLTCPLSFFQLHHFLLRLLQKAAADFLSLTLAPYQLLSMWQLHRRGEVSQSVSDQLFVTPWTAARHVSLAITNSQSLLKLMSIESVMSSNCLILYYPLFFLPSVFPSIKVFSSESVLHIRWPKYWSFSFSFSNSPSWRDTGYILFVVVHALPSTVPISWLVYNKRWNKY